MTTGTRHGTFGEASVSSWAQAGSAPAAGAEATQSARSAAAPETRESIRPNQPLGGVSAVSSAVEETVTLSVRMVLAPSSVTFRVERASPPNSWTSTHFQRVGG